MVFLNPLALWFAVPAVLAVWAGLWLYRRNYEATTRGYGDQNLLAGSSNLLNRGRMRAQCFMTAFGITCIAFAAARPAIRSDNIEFPQGTVDAVVVTDVSRSMAARDYIGKTGDFVNGTRLDMVRHIMRSRMIPWLRSNRLGIVSYAGAAFDQAYLTDDYKALDWVVGEGMTMTSAPGEGSCIADALLLACRYFDTDSPPNHQRIVVVFSDGGTDDKEEHLEKAFAECARRNLKVLVVGLGKEQPSAIPVAMLAPNDRLKMDGETVLKINGETAMTARDDRVLAALAGRLGGTYIRLNDSSDFEMLPLDFDLEASTRTAYRELYRYPLILGLGALMFAYAVVRSVRNPLRRDLTS